MLSANDIDDLIYMRLPEPAIRARLLELTPDCLAQEQMGAFVDRILGTLQEEDAALHKVSSEIIDCCGTGGSGLRHFNTSTSAAFVLASGGLKVGKFGNRSMSSSCGSFDFIEALGFPVELSAQQVAHALSETGLSFLYAPHFYPFLSKLAPIRKALGTRTIFNYLGPLLNPLKPAYRVLGVCDERMQTTMAEFLAQSGYTKKALLVRGGDSLDELAPSGASQILEVSGKTLSRSQFYAGKNEYSQLHEGPQMSGQDGRADTLKENLDIFRKLIAGRDNSSMYYRMVVLNAGAGFHAAGRAVSIEEGASLAQGLLEDLVVHDYFEKTRRFYARLHA